MEKPQYTAAHLKGMNRHVVYDFIRERGATSKAQIVKETGISPPTVIKIVSYLVERGLVVEAGEGAAGVGRRPQLLAINGPGRFSAVFALEGSFLSMGLVDISGRVLHRQKTRTAQDFGAFLAEVRDGLVSSLLHAAGADPARLIGVGVTLPGTYDPARRVLDYAPAIGVFGPVEIGPWMDGMTQKFGVPVYVATVFMTMCVSALALTSLDAVARIGRMSFQELFSVDDMEHAEGWRKLFCNTYFSTIITLAFGFLLTQVGYANIWPLFGSANQLLSALVLATLCVFLKVTGRTTKTLVPPFLIMLIVTFTALIQRFISLVQAFSAGTGVFMVEGLQLIVAVLLMILGVTIVVTSGKELIHAQKEEKAEKQA